MKAQELLEKATQAASSAKLLLDTGDTDGACMTPEQSMQIYAAYDYNE